MLLPVGRCWTISDSSSQPTWCPPGRGDGGLPAEELTKQLNRLRARAGSPSVRELAKLTEGQGPGRAMSRSTVQDKISGKNPPRLWQILALVQACADYARSIGAPLPAEETDEQMWRERVHAALEGTPPRPPAPVDLTPSAHAQVGMTVSPSRGWNLGPLVRAGMDDLVDLIQTSEHLPMAEWLPTLTNALDDAGMSNEQFLKTASAEQPRDLTRTIMAMLSDGREQATNKLMFLCTKDQPAESIPVIIALLRRWPSDEGPEMADQFISRISGELHYPVARYDSVDIVLALRSATMEKDVTRLLKGIGQNAQPDHLFQIAASFPDNTWGDRETVLGAVAKGNIYHLSYVLKELRTTALDGLDPKKTLDRIIFGISPGKHEEIAAALEVEELHEEASRVRELEYEPPF